MNQEQTKELLLRLRPQVIDFNVLFTGKSSRKVNGLYRPETREILLHNKNFNSDQELIYTALHEFAHHLHFTSDAPPSSNRCHTKAFWLLFHGLMAQAIEAEVYRATVDQDLSEAITQVRTCMAAEGRALKEKGQALLALFAECGRVHVRFEDIRDRVLGISNLSAQVAMAAFAQDVPTEKGADHIKVVTQARNPEVRREIEVAGGTLVEQQARANGIMAPSPAGNNEPIQSTAKLRARLESKLARLEEEAEEIRSKLETLESDPAADSHPADAQFRLQF